MPSKKSYAKLKGVGNYYKPKSDKETQRFIETFIQNNDLEINDIDLVLMGSNGDQIFDQVYDKLSNGFFNGISIGKYKHLCGEYDTASSFALWIAANIIRNQQIPATISNNSHQKKPLKNILIYNHFRNINHSLILVSNPSC